MESTEQGITANSHPSYELVQQISQASILQLVNESQQILQGLLANDAVWEQLAVYYPKAYASLVSLVSAFEQLSVLLQELNVLHNVEQPEEEEQESKPKEKTAASPSSDKAHSKRKKAQVGDERDVVIGGRTYRRVYGPDHKWHYKSKEHVQTAPTNQQ